MPAVAIAIGWQVMMRLAQLTPGLILLCLLLRLLLCLCICRLSAGAFETWAGFGGGVSISAGEIACRGEC